MLDLKITTPRLEQILSEQTTELKPLERFRSAKTQKGVAPMNTNHPDPKKPSNRDLILAALQFGTPLAWLLYSHWPFQ